MRISSIGQYNNIYAQNNISMKARKSRSKTIKDFKEFLADNRLVLNAQLTPTRSGKFFTELELAKKQGYTDAFLTDEDGYAVTSSGDNLNDAIVDMAEKYSKKNIYLNSGCYQVYKLP